jgi:hypothetical protein
VLSVVTGFIRKLGVGMSPYMQEVYVMLHHQEAMQALLDEKRAIATRQQVRRLSRQRSPLARAYGRWRLRWRARHARLSKRHYATPWLEDLHRIVEAQRRRERY